MASASIRTLFALIEPSQINSDWVDVVIPHELNHLVFDTAVENPYRDPPHWLDEGIAVYLSEGYSAGDRSRVESAGKRGELIPLDGLAGQFPATREKFFLAYAESVSAVDFFIRKYGRDTLIRLIRSYGQGLTDDDAFKAATGADVKAFNAAWLADLKAPTPQAYGPRPGAPGPVPPGWTTRQPASGPTGPGASAAPAASPPASGDAPAGQSDGRGGGLVLVGAALAAFAGVVLGAMAIDHRRRRSALPAQGPPDLAPQGWPPEQPREQRPGVPTQPAPEERADMPTQPPPEERSNVPTQPPPDEPPDMSRQQPPEERPSVSPEPPPEERPDVPTRRPNSPPQGPPPTS